MYSQPDRTSKVLDDVNIGVCAWRCRAREEVPATMEVTDGIGYNTVQDACLAFVMAPDDVKIEFIDAPG